MAHFYDDGDGDAGAEVAYPFLAKVDWANPPSAIHIPSAQLDAMGNMERQYWEIKAAHFNVVMFFKKGKFYELYDQDAVIANREFGLKLVYDSSNRGKMRLAGVPEQSFTEWARLFVFRGYKVGRVEQMKSGEDGVGDDEAGGATPSLLRGSSKPKVMPRDLVQILTQGTLKDPAMLSGHEGRFVLSFAVVSPGHIDAFAVDVSRSVAYHCPCIINTREQRESIPSTQSSSERPLSETKVLSVVSSILQHLQPKEVLVLQPGNTPEEYLSSDGATGAHAFLYRSLTKWIRSDGYPVECVNEDGRPCTGIGAKPASSASITPGVSLATSSGTATVSAQHVIVGYFRYLRLTSFENLVMEEAVEYAAHLPSCDRSSGCRAATEPVSTVGGSLLTYERRHDRGVVIDAAAVSNLELVSNLKDGTESGSFYQAMNRCCTNGGKRLFRQWVLRPSSSKRIISARQEAIAFLARCDFTSGWGSVADPNDTEISPALFPPRRFVDVDVDGVNDDSSGGDESTVGPRRSSDRSAASAGTAAGSKRSRPSGAGVGVGLTLKERFANVTGVDFERSMSRIAELKSENARVAYVDPLVQYKKNLSLILSTVAAFEDLVEWAAAMLASMSAVDLGDQPRKLPLLLRELFDTMLAVRRPLEDIRELFDRQQAIDRGLIIPHVGKCKEYDDATAIVQQLERALDAELQRIRAEVFNHAAISFNDIGKDTFLVEVPAAAVPKLPPHGFTERSRTAKSVKFVAAAVQHLAEQHKRAKTDQSNALVAVLRSVASCICVHCPVLFNACSALSYLDCLVSLSSFFTTPHGAAMPVIAGSDDDDHDDDADGTSSRGSWISARGLYHPLLYTTPVPNDVHLDDAHGRVLVLTGPNMAGKSTLMRTVAINLLVAQMGGYVFGASLEFSPIRRIFTRIGARDASDKGQSTLLVELAETSDILRHADSRSLCLVDELGRGTSTHDGYAIAYATLEYLRSHHPVPPLVLFSTHYHALAQEVAAAQSEAPDSHGAALAFPKAAPLPLPLRRAVVQLGYMDFLLGGVASPPSRDRHAVNSSDFHSSHNRLQSISFLYKLVPGICLRSYGVEVALMAGIALPLVQTAQVKSRELADLTTCRSSVRELQAFMGPLPKAAHS